MRERVYRTEALVIRRSDFGEADRLLVLATPGGKRRVVAKGVRKTTSKLAGHIELFTHAALLLAVGRNLDILTQSQVLHGFPALRADLSRLGCAYYAAELYDKWAQEEEENRPLFDLLVETLGALDASAQPDLALRSYELRLLHLLGYRPHLQRCAVCQELLSEQDDRFSPALGCMICQRDAHADRSAQPVSLGAFKLLRFLQSQPLAAVERLTISPEARVEVEQLLRSYMGRLLERELKSAAFLEMVRSN
jgi:DNA repair protein RecO (recombination protein O)